MFIIESPDEINQTADSFSSLDDNARKFISMQIAGDDGDASPAKIEPLSEEYNDSPDTDTKNQGQQQSASFAKQFTSQVNETTKLASTADSSKDAAPKTEEKKAN